MNFIILVLIVLNLGIFYTYIGYYLFLFMLHKMGIRLRKTQGLSSEINTSVKIALIISVYNGEKYILEKIENALSLYTNNHQLKIYILSDGSTDKTIEIANSFESDRVIVLDFKKREGKTAVLNKVITELSEDIIVFSDVDAIYDKNAIVELIKHFEDKKIGFVTGVTDYITVTDDSISSSTSIYNQIEIKTKSYEAQLYTCLNADGAIFAIRKNLYRPLKKDDINDFAIPLAIIRQNYLGSINCNAVSYEKTSENFEKEFQRQRRIFTRTIRLLLNNLDILNLFQYTYISLFLFSHKIFRLFVPFILILNLIIPMILNYTLSHLFLLLQIIFYLLIFVDIRFLRRKHLKFLSNFILINWALLLAWFDYLRGEKYITWESNS